MTTGQLLFTRETLVIEQCYKCQCYFAIPKDLYDRAKASRDVSFHCPHGHGQKFSTNQEVTPFSPQIKGDLQFGKLYSIRQYDYDMVCSCGSPMVQLKEFPNHFVFCENCFEPVATLDDIQADLNSLGNVQIEHVKKRTDD